MHGTWHRYNSDVVRCVHHARRTTESRVYRLSFIWQPSSFIFVNAGNLLYLLYALRATHSFPLPPPPPYSPASSLPRSLPISLPPSLTRSSRASIPSQRINFPITKHHTLRFLNASVCQYRLLRPSSFSVSLFFLLLSSVKNGCSSAS